MARQTPEELKELGIYDVNTKTKGVQKIVDSNVTRHTVADRM